MLTYKRKYGMDWPAEMPDFQIDMYCAKHWREKQCRAGALDGPEVHMGRALKSLFTREQFTFSRWTEQHIYFWCHYEFFTIIGAGACSKSNDIGCLALIDWLTDSQKTLCFLVSTTRQMLEIRSYEAVMRYYNILKQKGDWGVTLNRQRMAILNKDDDTDGDASAEVKAAIRGVAVKQGTVEEAKSNLQGGHLPHVRLIIDEMQQTREAAFEARHNLSISTSDFKFVGLANPDSIYDLSGRASKPRDPRGWASVSVDDEQWDSIFGKTLHHDGMKSPAVLEPNGAELYPHLIKQADIDRIIFQNQGNADAPSVWTMVRGFPPPQGLKSTVLTEASVRKFRVQEQVQWADTYVTYAALDPSFTSGGDGCVLRPFRVGRSTEGSFTILFLPPRYIQLRMGSELPVQYQIAAQTEEIGRELGFSPDRLVVDETGTQRVADVIGMQWGKVGWRYVGSESPTELPVSPRDPTLCNERYRNKVTEAWYAVATAAELDAIRGLDDEAARQFCMREVKPGKVLQLETKEDFKERLRASPDEADSVAMGVQFVRERLGGLFPTNDDSPFGATASEQTGFSQDLVQDFDIDGRDDNYLHAP